VVGRSAFPVLVREGRLGVLSVSAVAAVTGALAFTLPWHAVFAGWGLGSVALSLAVGGVAGAIAGAWFWLIAFAGVDLT